jgi:hypothetical protein
VEPVGELDEDDPDVLRHREQHLADVLRLLLLVAQRREARQLRDTVDEVGDLGVEAVLDIGQAVLGVLGDVVEERRLDGDGVDAEVGQDLRRRDRVRDVGLAGGPLLAPMRVDRQVEGTIEVGEVGGRMMLGDGGLQRRPQRLEIDFARPARLDRLSPARAPASRRLGRLRPHRCSRRGPRRRR